MIDPPSFLLNEMKKFYHYALTQNYLSENPMSWRDYSLDEETFLSMHQVIMTRKEYGLKFHHGLTENEDQSESSSQNDEGVKDLIKILKEWGLGKRMKESLMEEVQQL